MRSKLVVQYPEDVFVSNPSVTNPQMRVVRLVCVVPDNALVRAMNAVAGEQPPAAGMLS